MIEPKILETAIRGAAEAVIKAEPEITRYDTALGDGDCGQTLKTAGLGKIREKKKKAYHNDYYNYSHLG